MNTRDALAFALEFETRGVKLYMRLAVSSKNVLAKQVFYSLAAQEIEHARRIDEIALSLKAGAGWRPVVPATGAGVQAEVRSFFSGAARSRLRAGDPNIQGYEMAMRMERKGYRAYQEFHDAAQSAAEKQFFGQLAAEEQKHYEALANVHAYLTGNADWLQREESRTWNWMNT